MAGESESGDDERLLSSGYRRRFLIIAFLVSTFNFADRAVFAVLAQPIKGDLKLSDFDLGILQGLAFALLYAALGLPIGRLAERTSRVRIVAVAILFWSAMTAACGLIANFMQLLLCRIGVGMGEAGSQPATSSLVSDLFPRDRRASAMAVVLLGSPAGAFIGSFVGGQVAAHWGWRASFFALGLPGLLVGVLVLLLLREPRRGLVEGARPAPKAPPPPFSAFLRVVATKRSLLFVIIGGALAGFGMTSISQFLAVFLARVYELPVQRAGTLFGTISGVSLTIGLLMGSLGTDWLARRGDARWPAWGAAIALMVTPLIYWTAFTAQSHVAGIALLVAGGASMLVFYGPTQAMVQNLLEPRMRATGAALFGMLYTMIGSGLGPAAVGWLSDRYAATVLGAAGTLAECRALPKSELASAFGRACAHASAEGIRSALMTAVCMMFVAALFFLLASRTLRQDYHVSEAAPPA